MALASTTAVNSQGTQMNANASQTLVKKTFPAPTEMTPLTMIERAIDRGVTPEVLEKLLALQERFEATQARKEFEASMAQAKAKFKPIVKKHNGYGSRYKYEKLPDVTAAIDDALFEHGLSYDWDTQVDPDGKVAVTCILRHEAGHVRHCARLAEYPKDVADPKANMNGAQRLAATVTYLQRATLKASLGLAVGDDTDGRVDAPDQAGSITADEYQFIKQLIEDTDSVEAKVLAFVSAEHLETLTQAQYRMALAALQKRAKQMKSTGGGNAAAKP